MVDNGVKTKDINSDLNDMVDNGEKTKDINSDLNDMVVNGVKTKDINWENCEINIKIDIPVRFVKLEPLHQT